MPNPIPSAAAPLVHPRSGTITPPWMLFLAQLSPPSPNLNSVQIGNVYRYLSGLEPDKLSTNVLNINPGSCVDSSSSGIFSSNAVIAVDMSTVGANGLDAGVPVDGTGYFPYMIANNVSGALACVISASIIYGGVTVPAGYTMVRKLPFGFVYNSVWDGIPDFHLTHWPMPFIRLTGSEETSTWRALSAGTAATWTDVSLAGFMPDNARIVYLGCRTTSVGSPGFAAIHVLGSQTAGWSVGNPAVGLFTYNELWQRVTSGRKLQYQVTGGAALSLYVLGYGMTEPV